MIQIPFSGDSESTAPLRRCIERAAGEMGVSDYHAALLVSHFFEELTTQVSRNRVVRVPGFGAFGPKAWFPRNDPEAPGYAYPAFSAAVPFRNFVRLQCPATGAALDALDRHRRHAHPSSRRDRSARMPFTAFRAFRERISVQARRSGFDA